MRSSLVLAYNVCQFVCRQSLLLWCLMCVCHGLKSQRSNDSQLITHQSIGLSDEYRRILNVYLLILFGTGLWVSRPTTWLISAAMIYLFYCIYLFVFNGLTYLDVSYLRVWFLRILGPTCNYFISFYFISSYCVYIKLVFAECCSELISIRPILLETEKTNISEIENGRFLTVFYDNFLY